MLHTNMKVSFGYNHERRSNELNFYLLFKDDVARLSWQVKLLRLAWYRHNLEYSGIFITHFSPGRETTTDCIMPNIRMFDHHSFIEPESFVSIGSQVCVAQIQNSLLKEVVYLVRQRILKIHPDYPELFDSNSMLLISRWVNNTVVKCYEVALKRYKHILIHGSNNLCLVAA